MTPANVASKSIDTVPKSWTDNSPSSTFINICGNKRTVLFLRAVKNTIYTIYIKLFSHNEKLKKNSWSVFDKVLLATSWSGSSNTWALPAVPSQFSSWSHTPIFVPPVPEAFTNTVGDTRDTGITRIATTIGTLPLCSCHPGTLSLGKERFSNSPQNPHQLQDLKTLIPKTVTVFVQRKAILCFCIALFCSTKPCLVMKTVPRCTGKE